MTSDGLRPWPPPPPSHLIATRSFRDAARAAVLLVVLGGAVVLVALVTAFGPELGDGTGILCMDVILPPGQQGEGPLGVERTMWPLGVTCEFAAGLSEAIVVPEQDWTATIVALVGLGLIVAGAVVLAVAVTRRARQRRVSDAPSPSATSTTTFSS